MRRVTRWGIPLIVLLAVVYGVISYLIASGVTKAEPKELEDHPSAYGLTFEDVEFASRRDDLTLRGWYIPGDNPNSTLIFVHGIGQDRTSDSATDLASRLVARGFGILMFDLGAHGASDGDKLSGGYYERHDVLAAFDFLVERGVPKDSVGLIGFSMGAGTALLAAAEETSIRAVVSDSSYARASDLIAQETARKTPIPEWLVPIFIPGADLVADLAFDIDLGALVPERAVTRLGYPVLVIHGTADTRVPVEHGVRVHMASHAESSLWLVQDVDHVDAFLDNPNEYVDRVVTYFESRLVGE